MTVEMRKAVAVLRAAERLAITCHVGPDGDALGSALALAHAARAAGKEAVVAVAGRFGIGDSYEFLDTSPLVPVSEFPAEPEVMVVFDVGVPDRLGELAANAARAGTLVVVDHHPDPAEGFGDVRVIDPGAGAAAQLCAYLIRDLGWPVGETTAVCLLTGIVTDTGRFQYSSTDGAVLRVAADLVDAGARPEVIGQAVYESAPFGYLSVVAAVLGRAELDADAGVVWSVMLAADLEEAGIDYEDADDLIDQLRVAEEAGVAVLFKEIDDGFKVSLRSRGEVDVGAVAASEGGGGHHNAAGFTTSDEPRAVVGRIRASLGA